MASMAVQARDIRFAWPGQPTCLHLPELDIEPGGLLFLHGPSGSGKSTLLSILAGVLVPQAGSVSVLGQPWGDLRRAARDRFRADHIGYIFQQFNLLPYLSVVGNVMLPCRVSKRRAARAKAAGGALATAQSLLDSLGIGPELWDRPASQLSVGQQQRVAAARALVGEPELVIADEPTSALDAQRRDGFMHLLLAACGRAGSALVFVSHDERLAAHFSRSVSLSHAMQQGDAA
jgi:putative ABC transport system ATP-binding protein